MNEADTCREYVLPKLTEAGWTKLPFSITEQRTFTDGRIIPVGQDVRRGKQKRADYLLQYRRDAVLAVVEAKADYKRASDGMQQAKDYAEVLDLSFAYATNGKEILEFDFTTGVEREVGGFPSPEDLWRRLHGDLAPGPEKTLLAPYNLDSGRVPRYYQDIAIRRTVAAITAGKQRLLLTMATGTGKTATAFQICWKLWSTRWNRNGEHRRPKILYLADRNILVDDPLLKDFAVFGDAATKLSSQSVTKSRDIYFATYQSMAEDESRVGMFRKFASDFFDLVIVDECHRGSARADSSWRLILEHFSDAVQLGMTATPLRDESRDTYQYFGGPVYTYSLRQGIEDGFLAPYRLHRVVTSADAAGWRPTKGELDRFGREIPDADYGTKDFERVIALKSRTRAIATHLTEHLRSTDRYSKTIVFCVDQEHADEMRRELNNLNSDIAKSNARYVARVTADEGDVGRAFLSDFQDLESDYPVIVTTSQLLTTGVDAPMVKNVALVRVVGSMAEFKQIIGRGTRVRADYNKLYFNILDYTGSASRHFADPEFDGDPVVVEEISIDDDGRVQTTNTVQPESDPEPWSQWEPATLDEPPESSESRKYYVDGGIVEIAHEVVSELDASGNRLRVMRYTDYTAEQVRSLCPSVAELQNRWGSAETRAEILGAMEERGIDLDHLAELVGSPEADPFDLVCHVAFNAPLRTRRERVAMLQSRRPDMFDSYSRGAREVLQYLLDKYTAHGAAQFALPEVLKVPPISDLGTTSEIIRMFGGAKAMRSAVEDLQNALYQAVA